MAKPAFRVRCHYSGLLMGTCPDEPDLVILARDHDELASLIGQAVDDRASAAFVATGDKAEA